MIQAFDHSHSAWGDLLKCHVVLINEGNSSKLSYAGMLSDRAALKFYLDALSAVIQGEYERWPKN